MKRAEPQQMSTGDLVAEHDRLVRNIGTYIDDAKHDRLLAVADAIAERAHSGDPAAEDYAIYL
ncbi:hypothetical protein MCHLDSM_01115 [Mycolicibacterium chlorophenolicum]|uniref:Uncharacterized protein n=2 Tax=Mycolicibacterium chlorophenolicum TaxID=37916 RepID=A0A0J6WLB2_9MYCO|nr:hypothetical protein MCHLDSM_01115 [Mycolicibacterium chlorophenolicum]